MKKNVAAVIRTNITRIRTNIIKKKNAAAVIRTNIIMKKNAVVDIRTNIIMKKNVAAVIRTNIIMKKNAAALILTNIITKKNVVALIRTNITRIHMNTIHITMRMKYFTRLGLKRLANTIWKPCEKYWKKWLLANTERFFELKESFKGRMKNGISSI